MRQSPQHIAVVRLSAIGDVVLAVPAIRALQARWPKAIITWIIGKQAYSLLEGLSGVRFIVIDKPTDFLDYWRLWKKLKPYRFDVLLAMQASWRVHLIYLFIRSPIKLGFDSLRAKDGHRFFTNQSIPAKQVHLLEGFMQFAIYLGVENTKPIWCLPIASQDCTWVEEKLSCCARPLLAVQLCASKKERNWPIENYIMLFDQLSEHSNIAIVLVGGSCIEERRAASALIKSTKINLIDLVGGTSLKQLSALLGYVDVVLTPDTAAAHIATTFNTPVIGLYAVANPVLSGPYYSQHLVINAHHQALLARKHLDPEKTNVHTRVHDGSAMSLITVDNVLEKIKLLGLY